MTTEMAERMYDRLYGDYTEYEEPDINPVEEAWEREQAWEEDEE